MFGEMVMAGRSMNRMLAVMLFVKATAKAARCGAEMERATRCAKGAALATRDAMEMEMGMPSERMRVMVKHGVKETARATQYDQGAAMGTLTTMEAASETLFATGTAAVTLYAEGTVASTLFVQLLVDRESRYIQVPAEVSS